MTVSALIPYLNLALLTSAMLSLGLRANLEDVAASAKKFRLMAFGITANFILVPLATLALLSLFQPHPMVATGFLILAVFPGAPAGLSCSATAKGDVHYAMAIMIVLVVLSVLISPLLLQLLLYWLYPEIDLKINSFGIIKRLLLVQLLPLILGLSVRQWAPKWAERLTPFLKILTALLFFTVVAWVLATQYPSLVEIGLRGWSGLLLLLSVSLVLGWICGGPALSTRKTLALVTAIHNFAVALLIVTDNFPETPAVTAVVAYVLVSIFGALACANLLARIRS